MEEEEKTENDTIIPIEELVKNEEFSILVSKTESRQSANLYMIFPNYVLGKGGFGVAYLGSHLNGKFEEFKCIKKSNNTPNINSL